MESVLDILNDAKAVYYRSTDRAKLEEKEKRLDGVMKDPYAYEENKRYAQSLKWRITAKRLLLEYLDSSYSVEVMEEIEDFAQEKAPLSHEKGYVNTEIALNNVAALVQDISEIVGDSAMQAARVMTTDGQPMTSSKTECAQVAAIFEEKTQKINALLIPDPLLNKGVNLPDIKDAIITRFKTVSAFARKLEQEIIKKEAEAFVNGVRELRYTTDWRNYSRYPVRNEWRERRTAIILNTPYVDEAELAVVCNCDCAVYEVRADKFAGKDAADLNGIFAQFAVKGGAVIVTDLESYRGGNAREIINAACSYAAGGRGTFFTDESGNKLLSSIKGAAAIEKIALPSREYVQRAFEEEGLLAEGESVPEEYAFMGYEGVNLALREHKRGKSWRAVLNWLCDKGRKTLAYSFLREAKGQEGFIPDDWGDFFSEVESKLGGKIPFNYDCIPQKERAYAEELMREDITTAEKCAKFMAYVFDCDNSRSIWEKKEKEEKQQAITTAVKFIMQALGTGIVPDVQFHDNFDHLGPNYAFAVGLCCGGGKEILFKNSSVDILCHVTDIAAHESLHALQHTAKKTGWKQWMWEELGITAGRVESWSYNSAHYIIGGDYWHYRMQIMEADANAFAKECARYMNLS